MFINKKRFRIFTWSTHRGSGMWDHLLRPGDTRRGSGTWDDLLTRVGLTDGILAGMLLVVDAGNSHIVVGLYEAHCLIETWRAATGRERTGDEFGGLVLGWLQAAGLNPTGLDGIAIASVVPAATLELRRGLHRFLRHDPAVVGDDLMPPIAIRYDPPQAVGVDRVLNAFAAREKFGCPVVVVDLGTATTLDVVAADGAFVGGAIAPGISVSVEGLLRGAPHLPRVPLARPPSAIGGSTRECLQVGAYYGCVGQVEALIARTCAELGSETRVVATGGLAGLIAPECPHIDRVEPWLTLEGIRLTWQHHHA